MKSSLALFSLVALIGTSLPAGAADNSGGRVFALDAQNSSGEHGTVALKPRGDKTVVEIHLIGAPTTAQPAHVHLGSCAKLVAGTMAVNVHKSADDLKTYVACGDLTAAKGM
jgi:hypothetical protein